MRFCNECSEGNNCDRCNNQINEYKEVQANLDLLKRQASDRFG